MENIEEVFKDKNFDELTLHYINIFIEEFSELFGEYVSREELIRRIKENLNYNFEFADLTDGIGKYNSKEKKIILDNSIRDNEEKIKEVVFHEMIHCITVRKSYIGFSKIYDIHGEEDFRIGTARGLTEGFTQYLTRLRNERFNCKGINSYPILTEQTINLAELLGKEVFINLGLNNPEGLYNAMEAHNLIEDEKDYIDFLDAFDDIWKDEKKIFLNRKSNTSKVAKFYRLLNTIKTDDELNLYSAKRKLIDVFLSPLRYVEIKTIEDLEKLYYQIHYYAVQINEEDNIKTFDLFWKKLDEYIEQGHSREEVLLGLKEPLKSIVAKRFYIKDFLNLSINEQLKALEEDNLLREIVFNEGRFHTDYYSSIINALFGPEIEDKEGFYLALVSGLATEILSKGYNVNELSIEIINEFGVARAFNLYESNAEGIKYLSTYSGDNSEGVILEYSVVTSQEEIDLILEQNPDISKNAVIMKNKYGCIIAYSEGDKYILINDMEEKNVHDVTVGYVPSKLEKEYERLKLRMSRYEDMQSSQMPPYMLKREKRMCVETYLTICMMEGRGSINLENIGELVEGIPISEVKTRLDDYMKVSRDRKKAIEDGIGYKG